MKKVLTFVLVLLLAVTVLSACNKKASPKKCAEYLLKLDFEAYDKGRCVEHFQD